MARTKKQLIAVIGGFGFVGQHLIRDLQGAGFAVRIIDLPDKDKEMQATDDISYVQADICDKDQLAQALSGCTCVINLAAAHRDDIRPLSIYDEVNVKGAENVCEAAALNGIETILFTSSVAVYGFQKGCPDEQTPPQPFNPYGKTKWQAEHVYLKWQAQSKKHKLDIVRPTVIFGPGNRGNVYNLIAQLARGAFVMIGPGTNKKSMAYVQNVSAFLCHLVYQRLQQNEKSPVRLYNYCDKPDLDMNSLIRIVRTALGQRPEPSLRLPYIFGLFAGFCFDCLSFVTRQNFPISMIRVRKFCANTVFAAEALQQTGFIPPYDFSVALQKTISYEFGAKNQ